MSALRTLAQCQQALRSGQQNALQLTEYFFAEISARDAQINSFLSLDPQGARRAAIAADRRRADGQTLGPLDGIPFAVKDNIAVSGLPLTAGMATRRHVIAEADASCVAALRAQGMVMLGKLNMHEGALGADNNNPHFGACHNPHRFGFTPGGSSGGSAAALAAGFVPCTLGTDTMGSVRIPAAYCGVVGFKPSFGRISQRGLIPACYELDHVGLLTHHASELALLYDALNVADIHDPYQLSFPDRNVSGSTQHDSTQSDLPAPRIAALQRPADYGVDQSIATHFSVLLERLSQHFAIGTPISFLDYDFAKIRRAGLLATEADMAAFHAEDLRTQPQHFSNALRDMLLFAASKTAPDLALVRHRMQAAKLKARSVFGACDVLLTPTTPQPAFAFGSPVPANQADLTSFANLAGCPAVSLPTGSIDGLPVGLQLIAAPGQDQMLIRTAIAFQAVLEQLHG